MRSLLRVALALLLLAVLLTALSYSMLRAQGPALPSNLEGRRVMPETRAVSGAVANIDLNGPINLSLRQGAVPSLVVRGEQRLLGNIDTSEEGGILHIGTKGMLLNPRHPIQVTLVLPRLDQVSVRGSGDSSVNGFSGERIDVQLSGSGNLKFNGRYRQVSASLHGSGDMELNGGSSETVDITLVGSGNMTVVGSCRQFALDQTGSGDLDGEHMSADEANVELKGSGGVSLTALKSIAVTLRGSGGVNVFGNPSERHVTRSGSGDVSFD